MKNNGVADDGQGKTTNDASQRTRKRFAMIPECAAACPGLEVFDYRVLIAIGCHVNGNNRIARVSQATICRTMGLKDGNRTRVRESVKRTRGRPTAEGDKPRRQRQGALRRIPHPRGA